MLNVYVLRVTFAIVASVLWAPNASNASDKSITEFLSTVEDSFEPIDRMRWLAHWTADTDPSDEHKKKKNTTKQAWDEFSRNAAKQARKLSASDPVAQRKLKLLTLLSTGILSDEKANQRRSDIVHAMRGTYTKACAVVDTSSPCLKLEALKAQLSKSAELRDAERQERLWTAWYDTAKPVRQYFAEYVRLTNQGARDWGYTNAAVMSRAIYEVDPSEFLADLEELWSELRPLYRLLHAHVRAKLLSAYGPKVVSPDGPIPIHLVGNLWGQNWEGIYDLVAFSGKPIDYDELLRSSALTARGFVTSATSFFESLGFPKLPASFEKNSYFTRPNDDFPCHPTAWDIAPGDYRLVMCIEKNWADFVTAHHEMGHIFHYQSYAHQPILFRGSPNAGISEAIGDAIMLSVTPGYLKRIGLLDQQTNPGGDLSGLLRIALRQAVRVQFGLMLQKWRWGVLTGEIPPDRYNDAWWELVERYQGLTPPSPRPKDAFDPGAKYHIAADIDYIRYFIADVLTFQIHGALSQEAGCKLPLHRCTIHGSKRAGERLRNALAMGSSRPWGEMLEALTGERSISAKHMRHYLSPLEEHLKQTTSKLPIGW